MHSNQISSAFVAIFVLAGSACTAEEQGGDGVQITLNAGAKDDTLGGTVVSIIPTGLTFLFPWEDDTESSVAVLSRTNGGLVLEGNAVSFDVSTRWVNRGSCSYDFECSNAFGGNSYCVSDGNVGGSCRTLKRPEGIWKLIPKSGTPDVEMGFILYDVDTFEADGSIITCGGQNVFKTVEFEWDLGYLDIDGGGWDSDMASCGLELTSETAYQKLAAFGVPLEDPSQTTFSGDYPIGFHLTVPPTTP